MRFRKINAVVSLLASVLILDHAIFLAAWMLSLGNIPKNENYMPWVLTCVVAIHALTSIGLAFYSRKGCQKHRSKAYPKMNIPTIIQRISGVLMIIFTWLHIAGTIGIMTPPQVVHAIVPPLFFLLVMAHVAVSVSKAFITLGIGNAKFVKAVDIVIKVICAATLIAALTGFYLYKV